MSVKCLNEAQKNFITLAYKSKHKSQKELAEYMGVSERTINRVLTEAGLATPVARIKGEAYQVMQLLKKYGITSVEQLDRTLSNAQFAIAA